MRNHIFTGNSSVGSLVARIGLSVIAKEWLIGRATFKLENVIFACLLHIIKII